MSKHAILSASASHRWLHCTPSGRLDLHFAPKDIKTGSSDYADEGTLAHELAEAKLKFELSKKGKGAKVSLTKALQKIKANDMFSHDMELSVEEYVNQVLAIIGEYKKPSVDIEVKSDFSDYVPDGFGTADVVVSSEDTIHIIDLKFGKGVAVSAEENTQLMLYALGVYSQYSLIYDYKTVKTTIIQPRLYSISTYELTAPALVKWANDVVRPKAELAIKGLGEFRPSDDICLWCAAKAACKAKAEAMLAELREDFEEPASLSVEEIADLLGRTKQITAWCKDIEAYALDQAVNEDVRYPGYKLVEGRSVRKITNETAVIQTLIQNGYTGDTIAPRKFIGLTGAEKVVGKDKLKGLVGEYLIKPQGAPTLVSKDDKRPEWSAVTNEDFEEVGNVDE